MCHYFCRHISKRWETEYEKNMRDNEYFVHNVMVNWSYACHMSESVELLSNVTKSGSEAKL